MNLELTKRSVLLIGDTIVDRYVYLKPTGYSLETPTVKCDLLSSKEEFGGAANVVRSLTNIGCQVEFWTSISCDHISKLQKSCNAEIRPVYGKTQVKERYYLTKNETYKYLQINDCKALKDVEYPVVDFSKYDIIAISDYRLGVISQDLIKLLPTDKTICQMQISDSSENLMKYEGFHCIVGNSDEIPLDSISHFHKSHNVKICVSTQGEKGVTSFDGRNEKKVLASEIPKLKDSHGAGDAFFAGFLSVYNFDEKSVEPALKAGNETARAFLTRKENLYET